MHCECDFSAKQPTSGQNAPLKSGHTVHTALCPTLPHSCKWNQDIKTHISLALSAFLSATRTEGSRWPRERMCAQPKLTQVGLGLGIIGSDLFKKRGFSKLGFKTRRQSRERTSVFQGSFEAEITQTHYLLGAGVPRNWHCQLLPSSQRIFPPFFPSPVMAPATRSCSRSHCSLPEQPQLNSDSPDGSAKDNITNLLPRWWEGTRKPESLLLTCLLRASAGPRHSSTAFCRYSELPATQQRLWVTLLPCWRLQQSNRVMFLCKPLLKEHFKKIIRWRTLSRPVNSNKHTPRLETAPQFRLRGLY